MASAAEARAAVGEAAAAAAGAEAGAEAVAGVAGAAVAGSGVRSGGGEDGPPRPKDWKKMTIFQKKTLEKVRCDSLAWTLIQWEPPSGNSLLIRALPA